MSILTNEPGKPFSKRNAQLFTYIGGAIVFTTFVVKDNLKDHWKETADAIDMAQYFYAVRNDLRESQSNLGNLASNLGNFTDQYKADNHAVKYVKGKVDTQIDSIYSLLTLLDSGVIERQHELDTIQILIAHVPNNEDECELLKLRQGLEDLDKRIDDALPWGSDEEPSRGESVADFQRRTDAAHTPELKILRESHASLDREYTSLHHKSDKFITGVLQKSESLRAADSRKATCASWVSAVLYTLGWALGLAGRIHGEDLTGGA